MRSRIAFEPVLLSGVLLNAAVLATAIILLHAGGERFTRFTREDAFVEWLQFLVFVALGALLAFAAYEKWNRPTRRLLPVLGLSAFSGVVFFAAGEEVSWFQRILDVRSPEFFLKHNKQAETNIHNLTVGGVSLHKDIMVKLIFVAGITHNLILPALALRRPMVRERVEQWGFYLPPLWVALLTAVFIAVAQMTLKHPRSGEITELLGAVHYLSTAAAAYLFGVSYGDPALRTAESKARGAWGYLGALVVLVLIAWLLGQA